MEADFGSGALHPGDLKAALLKYINECVCVCPVAAAPRGSCCAWWWGGGGGPRPPTRAPACHAPLPSAYPLPPAPMRAPRRRPRSLLEPVRKHFASGEPAKLLEQVKKYRVTR
jgi:hypothetical protein